jgi:competence protein ComEA
MTRLNACALIVAACLIGAATSEAQESKPRAAATAKPGATAVNINTATVAELQRLPGIGAATAGRIIEYREKNGPFGKPEELMNVRGIGEKSFLKLKPLVVVTPPKTQPSDR